MSTVVRNVQVLILSNDDIGNEAYVFDQVYQAWAFLKTWIWMRMGSTNSEFKEMKYYDIKHFRDMMDEFNKICGDMNNGWSVELLETVYTTEVK